MHGCMARLDNMRCARASFIAGGADVQPDAKMLAGMLAPVRVADSVKVNLAQQLL